MNKYIIGIVPANKRDNANKDADKQDSGKTSNTFSVALSPDGKLPVTHYSFCWWMSDEKLEEIEKDFGGKPDKDGKKHGDRIFDLSKGWTPEKVLEELHLKRIEFAMP